MNKALFVKIIIILITLGGIGFTALFLYQYNLKAAASNFTDISPSWTSFGPAVFAVITMLVCMVILLFTVRQLRKSAAMTAFQPYIGIDSTALDAKKPLCLAFYEMAYVYRCQQGSEKYQQNIVNGFHFFYEFHNYALKWIDNIVTRTTPHSPSQQFIKAAICSGHIGKIFCEISYGSGLAKSDLQAGAPLFVYSNREYIEIWSTSSVDPICIFSKKKLLLNRADKQQEFVCGTLNADMVQPQRAVQLTFRFPEYLFDEKTKKIRRHEIYATQNYQLFNEWLDNIDTQKLTSQQSNYGVTVEQGRYSEYDIPALELIKKNPLHTSSIDQVLRRLQGSRIEVFFDRAAMPIVKQKSALDFVLLCTGVGLVVVTEKEITGRVTYNCDEGWLVFENERTHIIENICLQAERAKASLSKLLQLNKLNNWPIHALVVFSAEEIELQQITGKDRLQCDVVKLSGLEQWIVACAHKSSIQFSKEDQKKLALILNKKNKTSGNNGSLAGINE